MGARKKLRVQRIRKEIQTCQKNLNEHVERMRDEELPKSPFKYKSMGKRKRLRPRKRWKDQSLEGD